MKRIYTRLAFIAVLLALALGAGIRLALRNDEPSFAGRPISHFLDQLHEADDGIDNEARWKRICEATNALHQMGPAGVAWLAARLENTNVPGRMERLAKALPASMRSILGIRTRARDEVLDRRILSAIVNSGAAAIPVLTNYLDMGKYDGNVREEIYRNLSWLPLKVHAQPAVPLLLNNARSTNDMDRVLASYAAAALAPEHKAEAIGILISVLEKTNGMNRASAASLLKNLGKDAVMAVPALEDAWRGTNAQLRREARYALQQITGRGYPVDPPLPAK